MCQSYYYSSPPVAKPMQPQGQGRLGDRNSNTRSGDSRSYAPPLAGESEEAAQLPRASLCLSLKEKVLVWVLFFRAFSAQYFWAVCPTCWCVNPISACPGDGTCGVKRRYMPSNVLSPWPHWAATCWTRPGPVTRMHKCYQAGEQ